ncbi:YhgE/Pip domain-containing protein [Streptomyces sp. H27-D2]|uniref:YhgE/Pip domain-containing protein n=1 Tax=Streptomyces sp. H27-D2 TaxID=3046304 RepID=UPI002DBC0752|nr:YhgE/Pip domain-containing protein [Streptomyces sp. H27-D2]MEC4018930.1 YhgE/Pip domain-containing protein [Streptomyces sp. H27-D2]
MRSPKLAALELKRFGRGKLPRAALAALLLLPLLYGALYLWSFWDPYGRLDKIPVALVNSDRSVSAKAAKGQQAEKIAAGDDIVKGLRDSNTFEWHETSAAEARKGVEDGRYYLSMTVPSDFSKRLASSSGDDPRTSALKVRTNDANNYIVGQISRTVFAEVRSAASGKASRGFYDKIFVSFSDIHGKTVEAAKGSDKLGDGIGKAKKGTGDLSKGLSDAQDGSGKLAKGLKKLDNGADKVETGAGAVAKGSGKVHKGAGSVADGTQKLADKANKVARIEPFLKKNGSEIGRVSRVVANTSQAARDNLDKLPSPTSAAKLAKDTRAASDLLSADYRRRCVNPTGTDAGTDVAGIAGTADAAGAPARPDSACPKLKKLAEAGKTVADGAGSLNTLVQNKNGELDRLSRDLDTVHTYATKLADEAPTLWQDLDSAVKKINALNNGAHKVSTGAGKVATGAGKVTTGVDQLHTGLTSAKDGADTLDTGIGKLSSGADTLNGGMYKLVDGSGKLSGGLHDGADQIPDYDKKDRQARTGVMSDPVQLASQSMHKAPNYGTGFAPYFIPLSLWVGSMVAYMLIQPLNRRALAAGASSWRIAVAGWLPVAALGVLQTGALMAVLHWGLGLQMVRAAGTIGFLVLVTGCFAAIVQWLNARFGPAGRILVLAMLMLQLTSAGGTYPVQTSPGFFNAIHPFLPMSYVVEGLRRLITGGGLGPVWQACAVLLAFTLGALALTAWSARRKQVWTLDKLHPELSL